MHLGTIDDSLVRLQDFYLCIRSGASNASSKLFACWRTSISDSIVYHELDPDKRKCCLFMMVHGGDDDDDDDDRQTHSFMQLFSLTDPITPLSIEMLAGEDLPHLLQTLLVGVEHAICRIPLDELTFPPYPPCPSVSSSSDHNVIEFATDYSTDERNAASKRAECNLKRRELITKNNSINKKYAVKRITCNGSTQLTPSESETLDDEIVARELTASTNPLNDAVSAAPKVLTNETEATATGAVASTLPLFCLGGSFPHIDSDEESGDDAKKSQTGECRCCYLLTYLHIVQFSAFL